MFLVGGNWSGQCDGNGDGNGQNRLDSGVSSAEKRTPTPTTQQMRGNDECFRIIWSYTYTYHYNYYDN